MTGESAFPFLPGPRDLLVKIPQNFEELRRVKQTLELYTENYYMQVTVLLISVYLFLQVIPTTLTLAFGLSPSWQSMQNFIIELHGVYLH